MSVTAGQVAGMTGLPLDDVAAAFYALEGDYVVQVLARMGNPADGLHVKQVTGDARRAVGQWPTADSLVTQLTEAFSAAADRESDPEQKTRLRKLAELLGGASRDIVVNVVNQVVNLKMHQHGVG
jgi:hypothetical protein